MAPGPPTPPSSSSSSSSSSDSDSSGKKNKKKKKKAKRDARKLRESDPVRTKEADQITIHDFPDIVRLPQWKTSFMQNVVAASGVRDGAKVFTWFLAVEVTGKSREDFEDPEGYPTLDRKIAAALGKIFKGELGRKVNKIERTALAKEQRMLSGREVLSHKQEP